MSAMTDNDFPKWLKEKREANSWSQSEFARVAGISRQVVSDYEGYNMKFILLAGSHNIRVLSTDETREMVIGVEGKKETLLSWLRSLGYIDEENLRSYKESMDRQT